jgi:hypothetical protein
VKPYVYAASYPEQEVHVSTHAMAFSRGQTFKKTYFVVCPVRLHKNVCTANSFPFMYSQIRFSQASLLISSTYFQNIIIMFCLGYSVEKYSTKCSHLAVSIGNNTYLYRIMKSQKYRRFMFLE